VENSHNGESEEYSTCGGQNFSPQKPSCKTLIGFFIERLLCPPSKNSKKQARFWPRRKAPPIGGLKENEFLGFFFVMPHPQLKKPQITRQTQFKRGGVMLSPKQV